MENPVGPTPVPLPADFQVAWESPDEPFLPWLQDRQHAPRATVPMSDTTARHFAVGASRACEAIGAPVRFHSKLFNNYYYMAIAPSVSPEEMGPAEMAAIPGLLQRSTVAADRWEREWLPELVSTWAEWSATDTLSLDDGALLGRLDRFIGTYERCWQIHFELLLPLMLAFSEFIDFHQRHLGGERDLDATVMLQGLDNLSMEAGRRMWALSREALTTPAVAALIREADVDAVYGGLARVPGGARFREGVDAFLREFGMRSDTVQDLADPSWIEEPGRFFRALRPYLENDQDPDVRHRELAAARERAVAEARSVLSQGPTEVAAQFEALLRGAQDCSRLQEDHNHWIDQRSLYEGRKLVLDIGQRLAARGQLDAAGDALFLYEQELRRAIGEPARRFQELVTARKEELDRFSGVQAPPMIGTDYGPPPPESPVGRAIGRFFGKPPTAPEARLLRGNPGSSGKHRGVARIAHTIDEAGRLDVGDVLVTPTTSPPWTPFFATAGAVVTETGGPLSHCAIVAREYGIPAVVGAGFATAVIRDGQLVEVDGDAGVVRLID